MLLKSPFSSQSFTIYYFYNHCAAYFTSWSRKGGDTFQLTHALNLATKR